MSLFAWFVYVCCVSCIYVAALPRSTCSTASTCWNELKQSIDNDPTRLGNICVLMEDANVPSSFASFTYCAGVNTVNTAMPVASASKWVSASTIAMVMETNPTRLNRSTFVSDILDWWPSLKRQTSDSRANITLGHLLSFTSALPEDDACISDASHTLLSCGKQILNNSYVIGLSGAPGTVFRYGGTHLNIAGLMALNVTSVADWNTLVTQRLLPRLIGVTGPFVFTPLANPNVAGGLYTTASNYMAFLRAYHRGQLLTDNNMLLMEVDATSSPSVTISYSPLQYVMPTQVWHYASGHWLLCMESSFTLCPELSTATAGVLPARSSSPGKFGFHPGIDRQSSMIYILANYLNRNDGFFISNTLLTNTYDALNRTAIFSRASNLPLSSSSSSSSTGTMSTSSTAVPGVLSSSSGSENTSNGTRSSSSGINHASSSFAPQLNLMIVFFLINILYQCF
jgi:hypothetical protein